MKKLLLVFIICLFALYSEVMGQQIIAGVVSPDNYYYDFDPDTSIIALPVHLGGMLHPPDTVDLLFGSNSEFILRFYDWGDGGLGGGGGDATVYPLAGEAGFRAYFDSCYGYPGVYDYFYVPNTLNLGDTIKSGQNYLFGTTAYFWSSTYGNWTHPTTFDWVDIGDHYLGFTLINPGDTLYGWVRINVTQEEDGYRTTLKDFALDHNPWVGNMELTRKSAFTIFPNPAKEAITITNFTDGRNMVATLMDITGQIIQIQPFVSRQITLEISSLNDGLYLIVISGDHSKQVLKFVKNS
ncbi:MAG: T9SS type A sorting domain-containing protein [Bacteroidales bacterium]|nr:T9SS type A sorting domain-containing protein [Bacteroidales bacterium]